MKNINQKKGFTLLYAVIVSSIILAASISIINISLKQYKLSALSRESQIAFYAANTGVDCAVYWDIKGRPVTDAGGDNMIDVFPAVQDNQYDSPTNNTDNNNSIERTDDDSSTKINCLGSDILQSTDFYELEGVPLDDFYNFTTESGGLYWNEHLVFANSVDQEEYCLDPDLNNAQEYRTWTFQVVLPNNDGTYLKSNACAVVSVCKNLNPGASPGNEGYSTIYTSKGYNTCDISRVNVVERGIRLIQQ